ncbi:MAG TPA: nuclear transport factor 2 family protein [Chitinophaga sp.]|uniref:nuclear transport factor 2 family protein n=1 Tax=Chitinophaga sp. TaxID=1869181 RepID=UPI002CFEB9CA|nr:nuclear transport factor 2 family protein [Chitinophaga sp.]HVI48633.1 nuclear transport factor 2 family protein [Chitinophaga sp.]
MRSLFCILALTFSCAALHAQSNDDAIKATVNKLFDAMRNADSAALRSCFTSEAIMQTVINDKEGHVSVETSPVSGYVSHVAKMTKGDADERIVFDMIKVDGNLASVWTPYSFYYKQRLHHCGADSFQLVKLNGEWKIQFVIDTRRKDGCKE